MTYWNKFDTVYAIFQGEDMSDRKRLVMAPEFRWTFEEEIKYITLRKGQRDYFPGDVVRIVSSDNKWSCLVRISTVTYSTFSNVPVQDFLDDGFATREDMFEGMKEYYPDITWETVITAIRWDRISDFTEGVPKD